MSVFYVVSSFVIEVKEVATLKKMEQENINNLPLEIMMIVFEKLAHKDLFKVVRVCKHWKAIGDFPCLWENHELVLKQNNLSELNTVLRMHRYQVSKTLYLDGGVQKLDNVMINIIINSRISKLPMALGISQVQSL